MEDTLQPYEILAVDAIGNPTISIHNYMGVNYGTYKNTNSFPISQLPLGIYLIKIQNQVGYFFTLKFVKQ